MLTRDLPAERLKRDGYSAEVFNALGDSIAVITVSESALEPLREDEVCCVRPLAAA